jgi:hypothetical protein
MKDRNVKQVLLGQSTSGRVRINGEVKAGLIWLRLFIDLYITLK